VREVKNKGENRKMSRIYDVELECGCLTSTTSDILIPCFDDDNCKFNEWIKKKEKIAKV